MRVLSDPAQRIRPLWLAQRRHIAQALLPLVVDVDHTPGSFKKLREACCIVSDVIGEPGIHRGRRTMTLFHQPIEIFLVVGRRRAIEAVFPRDRVPFLPVIRGLDQRIGEIAQHALVVRIFETRRRHRARSGRVAADPVVDAVGDQRRIDFPEISIRALSKKTTREQADCGALRAGSGSKQNRQAEKSCSDQRAARRRRRRPALLPLSGSSPPSGSRSMRMTGRMMTVAGSELPSTYLPRGLVSSGNRIISPIAFPSPGPATKRDRRTRCLGDD